MTDTERQMWEQVLAQSPAPRQPSEPLTIHYSELPESPPSERGAAEWNYYRREVGRLLAEGHEGQWVLIKGEEIIGIWDTSEEADRVRLERFLMQDVLMKQIQTHDPVIRGWGWLRRWR